MSLIIIIIIIIIIRSPGKPAKVTKLLISGKATFMHEEIIIRRLRAIMLEKIKLRRPHIDL